MLKDIVMGDITSPANSADIIIGMNTQLSDVTGIGLPFVKNMVPMRHVQPGSVLTCEFDGERRIHLLICHYLGKGGWELADRYIRFGLDHLDYLDRQHAPGGSGREYSIVNIGTGRVGTRDGADPGKIRQAIADSFLPVTLFLFDKPSLHADANVSRKPLVPIRTWSPEYGEHRIHAGAAAA